MKAMATQNIAAVANKTYLRSGTDSSSNEKDGITEKYEYKQIENLMNQPLSFYVLF